MCYNELNVAQTFLFVAEPLGEAGNRGARSRNAFVCMYIYISVPVNYCRLDQLRNRQDGAAE